MFIAVCMRARGFMPLTYPSRSATDITPKRSRDKIDQSAEFDHVTASVAVPCSCKPPITVHMGLKVTQKSIGRPTDDLQINVLTLHPTGSKVHPQATDSTQGFRLHPLAPDSSLGSRLIPRLQTPPQAPPAGPRLDLQAPGLTRLQHLPYCAMQGRGH